MASIARTFESSLGPWFGFASRVFGWCVQIVEAGLISAGLPCRWFLVEIQCRVTRQRVVGVEDEVLGLGFTYAAITK